MTTGFVWRCSGLELSDKHVQMWIFFGASMFNAKPAAYCLSFGSQLSPSPYS